MTAEEMTAEVISAAELALEMEPGADEAQKALVGDQGEDFQFGLQLVNAHLPTAQEAADTLYAISQALTFEVVSWR